jgi:hypothetical protein
MTVHYREMAAFKNKIKNIVIKLVSSALDSLYKKTPENGLIWLKHAVSL